MEDEREKLYNMNMERAKALFEYEMTSVMLAVVEDTDGANRRAIRSSVEMEIGEPKVGYEVPEIEPQTADFDAPEVRALQAGFELPEQSVSIEGLPETAKTRAFEAPTLSGEISAAEVAASLPDTAGLEGFSAAGLTAEAELPKAKIEVTATPVGIAPIGELPAAEIESPELELPETGGGFGFDLGEAPTVSAEIDAPEAEIGFSFELPQAEISVGEVEVAKAPKLPDLKLPEAKVEAVAAEVQVPQVAASAFELPQSERVTVSVDYEPAEPVSFETAMPVISRAAPEYPEIPEAPDISADISEILELVKAGR